MVWREEAIILKALVFLMGFKLDRFAAASLGPRTRFMGLALHRKIELDKK